MAMKCIQNTYKVYSVRQNLINKFNFRQFLRVSLIFSVRSVISVEMSVPKKSLCSEFYEKKIYIGVASAVGPFE